MLFSRTGGSLQVQEQTGPPLYGDLRPDWVKCAGMPQNPKCQAIICTSAPALIRLLNILVSCHNYCLRLTVRDSDVVVSLVNFTSEI